MPHRPIRSIIESRKLVTADASMSVSAAARLMREHKRSSLIVCEDGRLVGVFTEHDALYRVTAEDRVPHETKLSEVMTRNPQTISAEKPLAHALHMMYEGGFRHVPVVEDGRPLGMVSARDALGPELKEFVAEMDQREHIAEILG